MWRRRPAAIAAEAMPDDGHLRDLFHGWTPDNETAGASRSMLRRRLLASCE